VRDRNEDARSRRGRLALGDHRRRGHRLLLRTGHAGQKGHSEEPRHRFGHSTILHESMRSNAWRGRLTNRPWFEYISSRYIGPI
jgi:hypothetical protein